MIDWKALAHAALAIVILALAGLMSGCERPAPPYPMMTGAMEAAVNPYPGPNETPAVIDAPSCAGAVELPIAVWSDGRYYYSQLCTATATNGSELYLWDGATTQTVGGYRIPDNWPCDKYIHYPSANGDFSGVVYMTDAGGVLLCNSVSLVRNWHVFPITAIPIAGEMEKMGR